ncbi:DUF3054 domain-containing protein [Natrinema sp. 74]|uniref:DUF3054 domain-containing protein n=1 Tax=Natrinema sp. 74 TaxID=3384159 RepID=UPI0038D3B2A6
MDTAVRTGTRDGSVGRERFVTAIVDTVLVIGLVLLGTVEHGGNPLTEPLASLETVAPFAIGWIAVALLAGLYTREELEPVVGYRWLAVTWIAAANVGLMLRASSLFEGSANWPFPLVITGFGLLVLFGWRVGYALFRSATT